MNEKPIYLQLIEMLEDNIMSGVYGVDDLVISSTQICKLYNVNPATAIRALSTLADSGVLVKDRGIGMRVTKNARAIVIKSRKASFFSQMLCDLIGEAKKLEITKEELLMLIEQKFDEE